MTRVERALNEIKNEIEEKTVLEVACGCAEFSVAASKIATKVNISVITKKTIKAG